MPSAPSICRMAASLPVSMQWRMSAAVRQIFTSPFEARSMRMRSAAICSVTCWLEASGSGVGRGTSYCVCVMSVSTSTPALSDGT